MKKRISVILASVMLMGLCACGAEEPANQTTAATTVPATKPAPTVQVVEGQPVEQLDDVSVYIGVDGPTKDLKNLPAYTYSADGKVSYKQVKKTRNGMDAHAFNNTDAAAFINYLNALEADGWLQYSNNIIEGTNLFATYTKDTGSLYCYYISAKNTTYIVESPDQNLEVREQDNVYEKVCTPLLTQISLRMDVWDGGMAYLIRLSDGRFIVIDGGYREPNNVESTHLYEVMTEQNVLDKITIAAWIITHPHSDHLGVAAEFLLNYKPEDVTIQSMIYNFPTNETLLKVEPVTVEDTAHPGRMPTFLMAKENLWPDVPVITCHTGQVFHYADAKLEILHTIEDFYPSDISTLSEDGVNGSSVVFTLEVGGQKTIFYADSCVDESADLLEMWGDYLRSDIMQANHHGLNGGSIELFETTDPKVVMIPMNVNYISHILTHEHSRWIWNNVGGDIKEVMLSEWEEYVLELPYTSPEDAPYFSAKTDDPWAGLAQQYKTN